MVAFISGVVLFASCVYAQTTQRTITSLRVLNPQPPSGTRCSVRGSLAAANVLRDFFTVQGALRESCRDACYDIGVQCNSYAIHTDTNRCRLFKTTLSDQGYRTSPATPNVEFFGKACWIDYFTTTFKTTLTNDGQNYDDEYFGINLPFFFSLYNYTASTVYMSVNGILSISAPMGSYSNTGLPQHEGTGAQYLPPTAVCAFWDDLLIRRKTDTTVANRRQSLSWTITGVAPSRTVTFNWRLNNHALSPEGFVDVDAIIFEDKPNRLNLRFNDISDDAGSTATVGVQGPGNGQVAVVSTNNRNIFPGNVFEYQPNIDYWYQTA